MKSAKRRAVWPALRSSSPRSAFVKSYAARAAALARICSYAETYAGFMTHAPIGVGGGEGVEAPPPLVLLPPLVEFEEDADALTQNPVPSG